MVETEICLSDRMLKGDRELEFMFANKASTSEPNRYNERSRVDQMLLTTFHPYIRLKKIWLGLRTASLKH